MGEEKHITICGNYGSGNYGDEAILSGIISILAVAVKSPHQITVMSSNPGVTKKLHGLYSVPLFPCGFRSFLKGIFSGGLFTTLREVKYTDIFILGGGGLFTDEKPIAVFIWWLQARIALFYKKPVFCIGQSIGPLKSKWSRFLTKNIFKYATIITVRDKISKHILEELGVYNATVLADPVFSIKSILQISQIQLQKLQTSTALDLAGSKYVIFSLRLWNKPLHYKNSKILAQFIDWLYLQYGLKSLLIPFQLAPDNDMEAFKTVLAHVANQNAVTTLRYHKNFYDIIPYLAHCKAVIGMRLHSLIFSAMTNTPFLALAYSQKVNTVVAQLGQENYLLEWNNLTLSDLQQKFAALQKNRLRIKEILKKKTLIQHQKALEHAKILAIGLKLLR